MKYNVVNSDVCTFPAYRPKRKFFWGAVASGIAGLFGLAGQENNSRITKEQMQLQHRLNKDEMNHSMQLQKNQQDWLMNTMYGKNVSGMKNAGLNPATANGVSPATPSGGSPSSGTSGPSATNSNLGSDMANAMLAGESMKKDLEVKDAQKGLLEAQTRETNAKAQMQEWLNNPEIRELQRKGMESQALQQYAAAKVSDATVIRIGKEVDQLSSQIGLNKANTEKVQMETAKTYTAILTDLQGLEESEQRIALLVAEQELTKEKQRTEKASQTEHFANAAYARAGVKEREQNVNESKSRVSVNEQNIRESKSRSASNYQNIKESKAREAGIKIANRAAKWRQDVNELSGDKLEQSGVMHAKRIISIFNPLDKLTD